MSDRLPAPGRSFSLSVLPLMRGGSRERQREKSGRVEETRRALNFRQGESPVDSCQARYVAAAQTTIYMCQLGASLR